jgi:hypothetical protein
VQECYAGIFSFENMWLKSDLLQEEIKDESAEYES